MNPYQILVCGILTAAENTLLKYIKLEKVHRRFTKRLFSISYMTQFDYSERLTILQLKSFNHRIVHFHRCTYSQCLNIIMST